MSAGDATGKVPLRTWDPYYDGNMFRDAKEGFIAGIGLMGSGPDQEMFPADRVRRREMDERLKKQLDFVLEIDKEKNVLRQTHLSGHGRRENDAEHAWHMAVMAYVLREYANEPVDIGRTMLMCLIHDLVEIYSGDTYAYDEEGKKSQAAREKAAEEKLFSLLPEDQREELSGLFEEFNAGESPEAKFARAMDNLQPLLLNNSNGGGDWKEHGVSASQVYGRQSGTKAGSERLFEVTDRILKENIRKGSLRDDSGNADEQSDNAPESGG